MKKKLLTTALIGVMLIGMFSLSSCGKTSDGGGTPGGGDREDLKVVDAEWYGIDVYQLDSSSNLQQLVSESLFEWDTDKNEIVDGTCTDWTVSEDGLTITFNVPDGMYYSTGEQVEPEDVKASIEHGQKVSPYADGYDNIKSIDIDGRQVTLHLSNYRSDMLYNFTSDFMCIIDKGELDTMTDDQLMWGAHPYGMFYLDEYVSGSEVKLLRNDKYITHNPLAKNKDASKFASVDATFNVEGYTALESLKNGDVDFLFSVSNDDRSQLEGLDSVTIAESSYPEIDFIEVNTTAGPFQDKNLRKAFALLLDREALCDLTDGAAIPAYSMIFDTMQNFNKDAKDWFQKNLANNHDEGIKLIEAAGYTKGSDGFYQKDGQVLTFNFYASSSSLSSVLAEGLQGQFQNYGIQINLNSIDWNYVHEQVKSDDYDFARESLAWAEPILILNTCYYDKNAPTATDAYYAEVKDIAATVDSDERTKKIGDIQMKMFENIDILPFYSEIGHLAYSSGLSGVKINSDGSLDWNDVGWA